MLSMSDGSYSGAAPNTSGPIDWAALSKIRGQSAGGGNDLNMDWLNNTISGRDTYARYLNQGSPGAAQAYSGDNAPPQAPQAQPMAAPAAPANFGMGGPASGGGNNMGAMQATGYAPQGVQNNAPGPANGGGNPYLDMQGGAIARRMSDNMNRNIMPQIDQGAMAAGQFGGSRQGVVQANALKDMNLGLGDSLSNLYGNDWNATQNRNLSRYQGDQGFYTQQRGQDQNGALLGANLYSQGMQGQWDPLTHASQVYSPYTGIKSETTNQSQGGGAMGAFGGAMGAAQLWKNFNNPNSNSGNSPYMGGPSSNSGSSNNGWGF